MKPNWKYLMKKLLSRTVFLNNVYLLSVRFLSGLLSRMEGTRSKPYIKVFSNEMEFEVVYNNYFFWRKFNSKKWEPETVAFYKNNILPYKEVIDIGGWIGPTVLIAYSFNPKKITVVEADPANYQILKRNCKANHLDDKVDMRCGCIADTTGKTVSFGYIDEINKDTSTKAIGGERVKVNTLSLRDFLQTCDLSNTNIIKIDIEGGEQYIEDGLAYIAGFTGIKVLLSLHPPYWKNKQATTKMLLNAFICYNVYSTDEKDIPTEQLKAMMLDETKCDLGNQTGRLFTVILETK
jgi:FkbM family methyltransferase